MECKRRETACCSKCKEPPPGEFKKIIDLRNSGLDIYMHKNVKANKGPARGDVQAFVLHNIGNRELKRSDYINEMCQYKTRCMKCKRLVQKVHSLMNRIEDIKTNEVLGVCDICSCKHSTGNCKRCEYILEKYLTHKNEAYQRKKSKYLAWINKMYSVLQDFIGRESSCRHKMHNDRHLDIMIDEIVREFERKQRPTSRKYCQGRTLLEKSSSIGDIFHYTEEPEELVKVIKAYRPKMFTDRIENVKSSETTGCVCKYFTDKMLKARGSIEVLPTQKKSLVRLSDFESLKVSAEDTFDVIDKESGTSEYGSLKLQQRNDKTKKYVEKRKPYDKVLSDEYFFKDIEPRKSRRDWSDDDIPTRERHKRELYQEYLSERRGKRDFSVEDTERNRKFSSDEEYYWKRAKSRRGRSDEYSPRERRRRGISDEYVLRPGRSRRDWSEEEIMERERPERYITDRNRPEDDISRRGRPNKDFPDEYVSRSGKYRQGEDDMVGARKSRRDWSEEDIPRSGRLRRDFSDDHISTAGKLRRNWSERDRPKRDFLDNYTPTARKSRKDWLNKSNKHNISKQGRPISDIPEEHSSSVGKQGRPISDIPKEHTSSVGKHKRESPKKEILRPEKPLNDKSDKYEDDSKISKPKSKEIIMKPEQDMSDKLLKSKSLKEKSEEYLNKTKLTRKIQKKESKTDGTKEGKSISQKRVADKIKKEFTKLENTEISVISKGKKSKNVADNNSEKENFSKNYSVSKGLDSKRRISTSKDIKSKKTYSETMFLKLMNELKVTRKKEHKDKEESKPLVIKSSKKKVPKVRKLQPKAIEEEVIPESVIECDQSGLRQNRDMIRGTEIVPFDPKLKDDISIKTHTPLLFKIVTSFADEIKPMQPNPSRRHNITEVSSSKSKVEVIEDDQCMKGMLRYALSNEVFIKKGFTVLPSSKTMRRMNIYKMELANPQFDWFKLNKRKRKLLYDTGQKLAEVYPNGNGAWFYRNGKIALNYYTAKEQHIHHRYIIYSSGQDKDNGKSLPVTVLACFDHLGNGVVYDYYGNVRLKYNQTEGVVVDKKIGPPSKWKWHTLNDPPVLQSVLLETYPRDKDINLEEIVNSTEGNEKPKEPAHEMLAIEFENFVKEKANKLLQKFKPFQIRMKAVKINEQFSLRVLDQANISLLFQDAPVSLKLNLGMHLISTEIVDVETAEVSEVATPYDRFPPRTQSVADIQNVLNRAKKFYKYNYPHVNSKCISHGSKTFDSDSNSDIT